MRRIIAQARKELVQIRRDRLALTLALVLPVILLLLMGTAISLDVRDLPLIVQDFDSSPESRSLIDAFRSSLSFRIAPAGMHENPEAALVAGRARGAL